MVFPHSSKCCLWLENSCCPAPFGWPKPLCKQAQCNYVRQTISRPKLNQLNSISPCRQHMRRYFLLLIFKSCLLAKAFLLLSAILNSSTFFVLLLGPHIMSQTGSALFFQQHDADRLWRGNQSRSLFSFCLKTYVCQLVPRFLSLESGRMVSHAHSRHRHYCCMDQDCDWKQEFTFMSHSTGGFSAKKRWKIVQLS